MALDAAIASTISDEYGRFTNSNKEAIGCPREFWIMTPSPALCIFLNVAPSKFALKFFVGGGLHLTQGRVQTGDWSVVTWFAW